MKRIAVILLSTLLVLSLLAGCATPAEDTPAIDTPDVSTTTSDLAEQTLSTIPTDSDTTTPTESESAAPSLSETATSATADATAPTDHDGSDPATSEVTAPAVSTTSPDGTQTTVPHPQQTDGDPHSTVTSAVISRPTAVPSAPHTTVKPTSTAKPAATTKPTAKPVVTTKPTAKPVVTTKPTTVKPTTVTTTKPTTSSTQHLAAAKLNGISLSLYTLVYPADASLYVIRAASYICDEILSRTGAEIVMVPDDEYPDPAAHEILVGETNRNLSKELNADTKGLEFALLAKGGHVAVEADYFVIAAAAYYFVESYIPHKTAVTAVPERVSVNTPITAKADNIIVMIGDGMGINQTKLVTEKNADADIDYTDGENFFYGELLPYAGYAKTNSLDGVTDSAAGATALATGFKTKNGRIGRDKDKNDLKSITELALEMGKRACIMTTEGLTGATPGGFSAHADSRDDSATISACQNALTDQYPILFTGNYDIYTNYGVFRLEETLQSNLKYVSKGDKGFFMMYEEAHIDKHSHNQDKKKAAWAVYRFNQAIATVMEFAFYHPNTAVLITADHETGGLQNMAGVFKYAHGNHSNQNVPVFAYGQGMEVFHDQTVENVQIPKTLVKLWGKTLAAETDSEYPPLIP